MIYLCSVPPDDPVASGSDLLVNSEHDHASDEDRGVKNVDMKRDKYLLSDQISHTHTFSVVLVLEVCEHIQYWTLIG